LKSLLQKKVIKNFLAVATSNLFARPVLILRSYFVAKYLGPSDYGLLKSVELIQMLHKYGNLGFRQTVNREAGDKIGKGDESKVQAIKNTLYTAEFILSIILFLIGVSISLFFESASISVMIILSSAGLLSAKLRGIMNTEAVVQKNFILHSKISFSVTLIGAITVIILVPFLKIYAVLITNIITGIIATLFYLKFLNTRFQFMIDRKEFKRLLKISLSLTFPTLALGLFKYIERIMALVLLGPIAVGFYTFAENVSDQFVSFLKISIKVRMQDIFEGIGSKQFLRIHKMVIKETGILLAIVAITIPTAWFSLDFLIPIFLPNWEKGISAAKVFLFMMPLNILPNYASNVVQSSLVNKQSLLPFIRFGSIIIFVIPVLIMNYLQQLTIEKYIIANIIGYAFNVFCLLILYKKFFYDKHIKTK